jgi:hypothetical protein
MNRTRRTSDQQVQMSHEARYIHVCMYTTYIHTYIHTYTHINNIHTYTHINNIHTHTHINNIHTYTHINNTHTHTHTYIHEQDEKDKRPAGADVARDEIQRLYKMLEDNNAGDSLDVTGK